MHNALQYHLAKFSQRFQPVLLSQETPHTAARCYSRRQQVRWRQQRAGSVEPALQLALCSAKGSALHLGCKFSCLRDFSTSSCSSQLPGTPCPFFTGVHPQKLRNYRARFIYPSVVRDKEAHLAGFSFILSVKDLYSILMQCQPCKTSP